MKPNSLLVLGILLAGAAAWAAGCSPAAPTPTATAVPTVASQPPATRTAPTAAAYPRRVVIDTDMAQDDWMAILYTLQRTDLAVQAITVAGTGEAHCEPGVRNALGLVALSGEDPIPVACGRETPLVGERTFPNSWRSGVDGLMGLTLPEGINPKPDRTAVELLQETLAASAEPVTVLTLGPLTNLAELFQADPAAAQKIRTIYVMGGAVHVPGNLGAAYGNTAAEWNLYIDPKADNVVLSSGAPVTLVGLDATNHVPATTRFLDTLAADQTTPEAKFVYGLLNKMRGSLSSGSYYFWDPLTAAVLSDESLATFEQDAICVVEADGAQVGQTREGEGCPQVRVAVSADAARFEQLFLDTLNNPESGCGCE